MVLADADRDTLLAALTVDSVWCGAALPLLYAHLFFDPKGPRPGHVRLEHLRRVRTLDIFNHDAGDCAGLADKLAPDVVRIHFRFTLQLMLRGHRGGTKCPLLELEPKTVVFLDFDGQTFPLKAPDPASVAVFPGATERVLVWNISTGLDPWVFGRCSDLIFPTLEGDIDLGEKLDRAQSRATTAPATDDTPRSEVVILSNNTDHTLGEQDLFSWAEQWVYSHASKRHDVVNLQAFRPRDIWCAAALKGSFRAMCDDLASDYLALDEYADLTFERIEGLLPVQYARAHNLYEYRLQLTRYLTRREILALLPAGDIWWL